MFRGRKTRGFNEKLEAGGASITRRAASCWRNWRDRDPAITRAIATLSVLVVHVVDACRLLFLSSTIATRGCVQFSFLHVHRCVPAWKRERKVVSSPNLWLSQKRANFIDVKFQRVTFYDRLNGTAQNEKRQQNQWSSTMTSTIGMETCCFRDCNVGSHLFVIWLLPSMLR